MKISQLSHNGGHPASMLMKTSPPKSGWTMMIISASF
jgi:hypothetical protein